MKYICKSIEKCPCQNYDTELRTMTCDSEFKEDCSHCFEAEKNEESSLRCPVCKYKYQS